MTVAVLDHCVDGQVVAQVTIAYVHTLCMWYLIDITQ